MNKLNGKNLALFLIFAVTYAWGASLCEGAESWRDAISGDLDLRIYNNRVTGNEDLSFKTSGTHFLSDIYLHYDRTTGDNDDIRWRGLLYVQGTNDPQFKIRGDNIRIQNVYVSATKQDHWSLTGGYFSERFTPYTMNTILLGLNSWYAITEDIRLNAFYGRANRERSNDQFAQFSGGARLAWDVHDDHEVGVQYVRTSDDKGSLSGNEISDVNDTVTNTVRSLNYEGRIRAYDLRVRAEWAMSNTREDTGAGSESHSNENARYLEARWQPNSGRRVQARYEKVDPDFNTVSGFATTNRERTRFNVNQVLSEELNFRGEYQHWRDGLDGTETTSRVRDWRVTFDYHPEWEEQLWEERWTFNFENRRDSKQSQRERNWGLTSWNRFGKNVLTLGYEREKIERSNEETERIGSIRIGYEREFEFLKRPLDYELSTLYREEDGEGVDRTVRLDNRFIWGRGDRENIELFYRHQKENAATTDAILRNLVRVAYNYVLNREAGSRVSLSYEYLDNSDKEDSSRDYTERTAQVRLQTSF